MNTDQQQSIARDRDNIKTWTAAYPDIESVVTFKPNEHIRRLDLTFDIVEIRKALATALEQVDFLGSDGFFALPLNRRPGEGVSSANDLSGRYYTRPDETYQEFAKEELVDEAAFSELVPAFADTYFAHIHAQLTARFTIGRMRILKKPPYNCNSWHRDPEARLHIPIHTNPGALFIVNNHVTHMPADGSVYFTDTRGYHTALNGGAQPRVHLVAALVL